MAGGAALVHFDDLGGLELLHARFARQHFPPHFHDWHMVQVLVEGSTESHVSERACLNGAQSIFLSNPGEVHSGHAAEAVRYRAFYVPPVLIDAVKPAGWRGHARFTQSIINDACLARTLVAAHERMSQGGSGAQFERCLSQLVARFAEPSAAPARDRRIEAALEIIHTGNARSSTTTLARAAQLGRNQFGRLFKQAMGMSPQAYALNCRLETARRALHRAQSIAEVAHDFGFSDHSHFDRMFKRYYGLNPAAYCGR